jgi:hypothetical protein
MQSTAAYRLRERPKEKRTQDYNHFMQGAVTARGVVLKGLLIFLFLEYIIVAFPVSNATANAYGLFGIKRERLPLSTVPPADEALDVGSLDAMFAAHVISERKEENEFRVLVLGDSTIWGLQWTPEDVLPGQLNSLGLHCRGKHLRFYNLSFPRSSATKDIMILDRAVQMEPDAIVWMITWYTLMPKTRVDHWIVEQNPEDYRRLARRFDFLPREYAAPELWERLFTRNRELFRTLRFQFYSLIQLATDQDQIPGPPQIPATELSADENFEGMRPPTLRENQVSIDQVHDFLELAGNVPVLLVNEPILIMSELRNSDLRYNSYYPRWVYDEYRKFMREAADRNNWRFLDLWDVFPAESFADTPLHLTPAAHRTLAELLAPEILATCQ